MPTIADTNWKIVGRGDFDGDGKADVILRNRSTGQDIGWLMNGLTVSNSAFMPTIADTNWEIKGIGDFDGDGKADVILRNKSTGQDIGWLMNGLTVSTRRSCRRSPTRTGRSSASATSTATAKPT